MQEVYLGSGPREQPRRTGKGAGRRDGQFKPVDPSATTVAAGEHKTFPQDLLGNPGNCVSEAST